METFCTNCGREIDKDTAFESEFCDKKCKDTHTEEWRKMREEIEAEYKKDAATLEEAKKYLTKEQCEALDYELKETPDNSDFELVDKPEGQRQSDNDLEIWVDQRSVGISGDSFTGEVYIKLSNGRYLKYCYSC